MLVSKKKLNQKNIYLAIKESTYQNFFTRDSIKEIVQLNQILIIVVNVEKEEILQWIN
ncbi:element excision factor XisH family protein [Sphaerospermopsis aphanizomenoides]|uniref:element excision factor XisH family protein n=1 Tax=Sphaerospermopsis aphanizomenoides TaxID=459663 RepID=UPI001D15C818|nr:element excision factor XisH family protein [Sphaerospermopsis aphanizomenoides]